MVPQMFYFLFEFNCVVLFFLAFFLLVFFLVSYSLLNVSFLMKTLVDRKYNTEMCAFLVLYSVYFEMSLYLSE